MCIQKGNTYSDICYPLKSIERRYLSKNQAPRKHDAIKSLCFILASGYMGHPNLAACSAFYFPLYPNRSGGSSSAFSFASSKPSSFASYFQMSVQFPCHMASAERTERVAGCMSWDGTSLPLLHKRSCRAKVLSRASLSCRVWFQIQHLGGQISFTHCLGTDRVPLSVPGKAADAFGGKNVCCTYQRSLLPPYVDKTFITISAQWHFSFLFRRPLV